MELIRIRDFLNLTRLREPDLVSMLENGELKTSTGPSGELLIDISQFTPEDLANRRRETGKEGKNCSNELLEEMLASELVSQLEEMVDEALELALDWTEKKQEG